MFAASLDSSVSLLLTDCDLLMSDVEWSDLNSGGSLGCRYLETLAISFFKSLKAILEVCRFSSYRLY